MVPSCAISETTSFMKKWKIYLDWYPFFFVCSATLQEPESGHMRIKEGKGGSTGNRNKGSPLSTHRKLSKGPTKDDFNDQMFMGQFMHLVSVFLVLKKQSKLL